MNVWNWLDRASRSLALGSLLLCSCSHRSRAIRPPNIQPAAAAKSAVEQYDRDGDGLLSSSEIKLSALTMKHWDGNGDSAIDEYELRDRLERYVHSGVGMIGLQCYVLVNGEPLEGAEVTFRPEAFLGEAVRPAFGTTGRRGGTVLAMDEQDRPYPGWDGVQIGLYQVEIAHPKIEGADASETRLAFDVSPLEELTGPTFQFTQ